MNTKLACLVAGALMLPIAGYAADPKSDSSTPKADSSMSKGSDSSMSKGSDSSMSKGSDSSMSKGSESASPKASDSASPKASDSSAKTAVKDSVITGKIKAGLAEDKLSSLAKISVDTDDKGKVTLSGTATDKNQADKAVTIARAVTGVTSVKNDIKVKAD
jgi:hyperosmotically inducible protein